MSTLERTTLSTRAHRTSAFAPYSPKATLPLSADVWRLSLVRTAASVQSSSHVPPRDVSEPGEIRAVLVTSGRLPSCQVIFCHDGAPEGIRTPGLCLRRAALYPAELRVRALEPRRAAGLNIAFWRKGEMGFFTRPAKRPGAPSTSHAASEAASPAGAK
jgi:hypothetical protein